MAKPIEADGPTDLKSARKLLGPDAIIGITANSTEEAHTATVDGADYLGLGTIFSTQTYVTAARQRGRISDETC